MYNKNDPLVNSVKAIMEQNEHRRRIEAKLCEELGIYSRKQLPREHVANYDALLEQRMKEELVGNQHKIDANKNNRVDAHDFKLLRAKKGTMKEEDKSSSDPDFAAPRDPRAPKYKDEIEYKEEPKATMPKNPPMPPRRPPNLEETSHMKKLDELSLDKINAAKKEAEKRKGMADKGDSPVDKKYAERYGKYVELAKRRMKSKMDEENLDEVSREKLTRYIQKAKSSTKDAYYGDDAPTMGKRKKGIDLALLKKWGDKEHGLPEPKVKATNEEALDEKATPAQQKKIEKVMGEFKKGELNSGSKEGPEVTSRKQAVAIALSQAGLSKKKVDEDFDLDAVMEEIRAKLGEEAFAALMAEQSRPQPNYNQLAKNKAELQSRVRADLKANRPDLGVGSRYGLTAQGREAGAASARNITRDDEDQEFMQTRQQRVPLPQQGTAAPTAARPSAPQPADTVASSADRAAFRARTGSTVDSSTGQTQSNQPADTVASSADRAAFRARTGSTVGATQASTPAARPSTPAPSSAARTAATPAAEPKSRQMFQAAQDRASSGENDTAAFFAADKQLQRERGASAMQESKSLTSTINKVLKG